MDIAAKVVVVTGGAHGIGFALCKAFVGAGAAGVALADLDKDAADVAAAKIGATPFRCDVTDEAQIQALVAAVEQQLGPIDIFCSNAGVAFADDPESPIASGNNEQWQTNWNVHVMSHVYAARAVVPGMVSRGGGYLVNTASAAGLLQQVGDSAYSTTKHAAVGFAEAMAIAHGDEGIRVSVVCPQYVATRMIGVEDGQQDDLAEGVITAEAAAQTVLQGIGDERFLILTHEVVKSFWQRKFENYDRWIGGMRKLRRNLLGASAQRERSDVFKLPS